jgi:hypothetical protein
MIARSKQFVQHNKWLLPIVVLALVQLACSTLDVTMYNLDYDTVNYCDGDSTNRQDRFQGSYSCKTSAMAACPIVNGERSGQCLSEWRQRSYPRIFCPLNITGPNVIGTDVTSATFTWASMANIEYYQLVTLVNGRLLVDPPVRVMAPGTSATLPVASGNEPIELVITAHVGTDTNCRSIVTIPRIAPSTFFVCDGFRLTAPLDGLPNGMTTFYWDALPDATGYRLSVADATSPNTPLTSLSVAGDRTNLTLDLSSRLIGGGTSLIVTIEALNGETVACADSHTLTRAWPAPPAPPENTQPAPFCGDRVCSPELGEDNETCTIDCPLGG